MATMKLEETLSRAVNNLRTELKENLFSCCVYGSAVRGNVVKGLSDINLLILLNDSNATAHEAISRAIGSEPLIDPFVLTRHGFERSERAFAPKFASIKRNYRVLYGADPLAHFTVDSELEKFLCEQAIRNLRLRWVHSFVTRRQHNAYDKFVVRHITPLFLQLSEVLRLNGATIPAAFEARVPLIEKAFGVDGQLLRDLAMLKQSPKRFSETEAINWHERLFPVLNAVVAWIESNWPAK